MCEHEEVLTSFHSPTTKAPSHGQLFESVVASMLAFWPMNRFTSAA